MKKTVYLFIIAIAFISFGCEKNPMDTAGIVYTGEAVIEFASPNGSFSASGGVLSKTITTTAPPKLDSIRIQLVAAQRSAATNVTFAIDAGSTAVQGVDYILTSAPGTTVSIPANSSWFTLMFQLNKVTAAKTLKINLISGDKVKISENYKSVVLSLK